MFGSDEETQNYLIEGDEIGGVGALSQVLAARAVEDYTPEIEFGEPRLVDRADGPVRDFYVIIPTFTPEGEPNPANVEFPVPDDPDDVEEELNQFLEELGVDGVEEIESTVVDSVRDSGVLRPALNAVEDVYEDLSDMPS